MEDGPLLVGQYRHIGPTHAAPQQHVVNALVDACQLHLPAVRKARPPDPHRQPHDAAQVRQHRPHAAAHNRGAKDWSAPPRAAAAAAASQVDGPAARR
eukprot:5566075-Prymnesium_polylepis.1